jgi:hypothetical protein
VLRKDASAYLSSMHIADVPAPDEYLTPALAAASIAHEVSQPLTGIFTNATICMWMLAADPPNILAARDANLLRDAVEAMVGIDEWPRLLRVRESNDGPDTTFSFSLPCSPELPSRFL